jgi:hypothetical protein
MDIAADVWFWAVAHKWRIFPFAPFVIGFVVVKILNR